MNNMIFLDGRQGLCDISFSLHSLKGVMKGDKGLYRVQGLESKFPKGGL